MKMDREETKMGREVGTPLNTNAERGEVEERPRKYRVCEFEKQDRTRWQHIKRPRKAKWGKNGKEEQGPG